MSYGSYDGRQPGTNEVREAAREKAREIREQHKKKDRRRRAIRNLSIIGATVAIVGIVALVLVNVDRGPSRGPLNMASDGIKIGSELTAVRTAGVAAEDEPQPSQPNADNVLDIRIYVDYLCPNCGEFMAKNGDNLQAWAESGAATVEIHPLAPLTTKSAGDQYSLRAANAAACVAEYSPDSFFAFHRSLFVNQPKEGEAGFSDDELVDRAQRAGGINMSKIEDCIKEQQFSSWVRSATVRALNGPLPDSDVEAVAVTPTILVNGKQFKYSADFDPNELSQFIVQAAGESFNANPTPEPTPSASPSTKG